MPVILETGRLRQLGLHRRPYLQNNKTTTIAKQKKFQNELK
jgi:hypothetical protein